MIRKTQGYSINVCEKITMEKELVLQFFTSYIENITMSRKQELLELDVGNQLYAPNQ